MQRFLQQLLDAWRAQTAARQVAILLAGGVVIAALIAATVWSVQPQYAVLVSGVSEEEAGQITAELQTRNVNYKLSGTTIRVPAEQLSQIRVDLARANIPLRAGKGLEAFDEAQFGTTPFVQQVNYNRAIQAEIARSIMQLEPVSYARVLVSKPEPSPFIREQRPATASVLVRLKPGATLTKGMASGIAALVARSVEGLTPENVTIVDQTGRVLSESAGAEAGAVSSQLDYRREVESYLARKAEDLLAQALGPGRAVVRVTAEVNFKKVKERRETFNPDERVVTAEKTTTSKTTSGAPAARGVAGAASNIGRAAPTALGPSASTSQDETTETQYRVSRIEQELEEGRGNVERLTVAAFVDLSADGDSTGKRPTQAKIEDIIKQAVGFKAGRDAIAVEDVRLASVTTSQAIETEAVESQRWQYYIGLARNASLGVAALVALLLGWIFLRRLRPAPVVEPPPLPATERERVVAELTAIAEADPELVARILAAWLEEGGSAPPAPA
jgi:flagellar M-ring protein FliF